MSHYQSICLYVSVCKYCTYVVLTSAVSFWSSCVSFLFHFRLCSGSGTERWQLQLSNDDGDLRVEQQ